MKGLDDQLRELNLTIHTMEKEYTDVRFLEKKNNEIKMKIKIKSAKFVSN